VDRQPDVPVASEVLPETAPGAPEASQQEALAPDEVLLDSLLLLAHGIRPQGARPPEQPGEEDDSR
jgi:hypothetical protein